METPHPAHVRFRFSADRHPTEPANPIVILTFVLIAALSFLTARQSSYAQHHRSDVETKVMSQSIDLELDLPNQQARITSEIATSGTGTIEIRLPASATIHRLEVNDQATRPEWIEPTSGSGQVERFSPARRLAVNLPRDQSTITIEYTAVFDDDPSAGEIAGQIHNFSVSAHIGQDGVFLSDNAGWHPMWIDPATDTRALIHYDVSIQPIEEWSFVASGNPARAPTTDADSMPAVRFTTPRPMEGVAVVGNQHVVQRRVHETAFGPVELVMQTRPENESFVPLFLDAAERYLDLYNPILGEFPYKQFTIVENFFSSGFAFPGFTVLGPQVIPMGERALAPGYLDHELLHNWWGNGVYVEPNGGNWCEALTSYCANYYRRILDDSEDAGLEYRRGILMKLATDPESLDNAPLAEFGLNPAVNRFVGYDKGAFVFMMIEAPTPDASGNQNRDRLHRALRSFAADHLGKRADWNDLQASIEREFNRSFDAFFKTWMEERTLPTIRPELGTQAIEDFKKQLAAGQHITYELSRTGDGGFVLELDPEYYLYRKIPESKLVPTVAGTMGQRGMRVEYDREEYSGIVAFVDRLETSETGENLLLIGRSAAQSYRDLLLRADNPIAFDEESFTVGGTTYAGDSQAVLHTMHHPDYPGRFLTVYLANGFHGWSHLNYMTFYSRDTTVVWDGRPVIERSTFVPDQRYRLED